MRLFIAVDLPAEIKREIGALHPLALKSAKEVPLSQLHLTLRFIGDADPSAFDLIRSALRKVSSAPFSLRLRGIGVFPNAKRPRILWSGFDPSPPLLALQSMVEETLTGAGLAREDRPFVPHLTLARFRIADSAELGAYLQGHRDFQSTAWTVSAFHLYSSRLDPGGAIHKIEESYKLM